MSEHLKSTAEICAFYKGNKIELNANLQEAINLRGLWQLLLDELGADGGLRDDNFVASLLSSGEYRVLAILSKGVLHLLSRHVAVRRRSLHTRPLRFDTSAILRRLQADPTVVHSLAVLSSR